MTYIIDFYARYYIVFFRRQMGEIRTLDVPLRLFRIEDYDLLILVEISNYYASLVTELSQIR